MHKYHTFFMKLASSVTITLFASLALSLAPVVARAAGPVEIWWPSDNARLQGSQPIKAMVQGLNITSYDMYWQVDGGTLVPMNNSWTDYQHKEATIDVSAWSWRGAGPYTITVVAKQNGSTVAQKSVSVTVGSGSTPSTTTNSTVTPTNTQSLTSFSFYVDPNSAAAKQVQSWATSRPTDAQALQKIANAPTATWFGGWSGDIQTAVSKTVSTAANTGKTAVLVAYNIPQRDCGGYSAGGASDYTSWIEGFARGIGSKSAVVILEPDSVALMNCLSTSDQAARLSLLAKAVGILKSNPNTKVYVDAGHAGWVDAATMASRLKQAGVSQADGFSLNVSNFGTTADETKYGSSVSSLIGGKHFVIDTSRNGNGSNGEWCNPSGRTIGPTPTTQTGNSTVDAYLWVKVPGESDGTCNGGPSAGSWWPDYALSLVKNTH